MARSCPMCGSRCLTLSLMRNHFERYHKHDTKFHVVCQAPRCFNTYDNFEGYKTHLRRKHRDILNKVMNEEDDMPRNNSGSIPADDDQINMDDDDHAPDDDNHVCNLDATNGQHDDLNEDTVRKLNAAYLLGTKEKHKLTQRTVDTIIKNTSSIVQNSIELLRGRLSLQLRNAGVDFKDVPELQDFFHQLRTEDNLITNPFVGMETKSQQDSVFKELFGLVEPMRRVLGVTHSHVRNGVNRKTVSKPDEVIEVPLLKSLEQMLNDPAVLDEVLHPHHREDNLLADFCDGTMFKNHPLFSVDPTALQIILYYDEVEVANPLGSKTGKHKLGLFYYTLGNISPQYRSQMKAIQLLAVAKRPIIKKYGINAILKTFMEELAELEQDEGHQFSVKGILRPFRGTIAYVSGDNLGSQEIGGFKIGPGAHLKCRECMGLSNDLATKFHEQFFHLRTSQTHDGQCRRIENSEADLSSQFGICHSSVLNQSRYFHVIGGLPGDAMHDVLEGILQYEAKEFLKYVILHERYLSLHELNERLLGFDYGYSNDKNKPSLISSRTLNATNNSLKQSASQAWCLAIHLPLLLGNRIPKEDEKYQLFLLLLEIVELVFSPLLSREQASYLQSIIEEHHTKFVEHYPTASIIPKMHYIIHYPRTIVRLGPMVRSWCMRYESKHTYFKQVAIALGNFINVPFTVADRHQKLQSFHYFNEDDKNSSVITKPLECGPGSQSIASLEPMKEKLKLVDESVQDEDLIYKPSWVNILGTKYKIGAVIHMGFDESLPVFAVVKTIYVLNSSIKRVYFLGEALHTEEFCVDYRTYSVRKIVHPEFQIIPQRSLQYFLPLHFVKPVGTNNQLHILPKYDIFNSN